MSDSNPAAIVAGNAAFRLAEDLNDYVTWKDIFESFLEGQGLKDAITKALPEQPSDDEKKMHSKTKSAIILAIPKKLHAKYASYKCAHLLWTDLSNTLGQQSFLATANLKSRLLGLTLKDPSKVNDVFQQADAIMANLRSLSSFTDADEMFFYTELIKNEPCYAHIRTMVDLNSLTGVKTSTLNLQVLIRNQALTQAAIAPKQHLVNHSLLKPAQDNKKGNNGKRNGKKKGNNNNGRNQGNGQGNTGKRCTHHPESTNHDTSECRFLKAVAAHAASHSASTGPSTSGAAVPGGTSNAPFQHRARVIVAEADPAPRALVAAPAAQVVPPQYLLSMRATQSPARYTVKAQLLGDQGASYHFIGDRTLLTHLRPCPPVRVSGIGAGHYMSSSFGTVTIATVNGNEFSFGAYYVPGLEGHFFSTAQFGKTAEEFVIINAGICRIQINDEIVILSKLKAHPDNPDCHQYLMDVRVILNSELAPPFTPPGLNAGVINVMDAVTVHRRLAHVGSARIKKTGELLGEDFPLVSPNQKCNDCMINKWSVPDFKANPTPATKVLERVSSDLAGPFQPSINGESYYMTITDQFSRFCKVIFLKHKSDAFQAYKAFVGWAEAVTDKKLLSLLSDNGGEYTSNAMAEFNRENNIQHDFSSAYTPQTNGMAESRNRSLKGDARCLLNTAKVPETFWSYAVAYANFIHNRVVSTATERIPHLDFLDKVPSLNSARVFGCRATIKNESASGFEPRSTNGVFSWRD